MSKAIAIVLKGYPRLSETFIAQEILGLERAGFRLHLISMRHPTDRHTHPVHDEIRAGVNYLPEYLHDEPLRVFKSWWKVRKLPGYKKARKNFLSDLVHDVSRNRVRRFGQALVMAAELPGDVAHLHAHFIHTPASVTSYVSDLTGLSWTCSAHAKDIWTSSPRDLKRKLKATRWVVTCTANGQRFLQSLCDRPGQVRLSYHGLDLSRFAPPGKRQDRPDEPVMMVTVCRAVEKKGLDVLLDALALLPRDLNWKWRHIGDGGLVKDLKKRADELGISSRIEWQGALPQTGVLACYRASDLFVLPCRIAANGDRDGLPNVIVEAQSQRLPVISTTVSGVPELVSDGENGLLVEPEDPKALSQALQQLIVNTGQRREMGKKGEEKVRRHFDHEKSITDLTGLFASIGITPDGGRP